MANIEHEEVLDRLDKLSVCLYRTGISLFALALIMTGLSHAPSFGLPLPSNFSQITLVVTATAAALSAANLHVYDKVIRAIIVWSSWLGLTLVIALSHSDYLWLAQGFIFITFSGIAVKESFCFKVPGLKIVPLLLASAVALSAFKMGLAVALLSAVCAAIFAFLAVSKWKMPLHFDIGDKSNYQI